MDLGIYLYSQSRFDPDKDFATLKKQVIQYENDGFSTIWTSDEMQNRLDPKTDPHYETLTLLTALSQHTSKIKFGAMVSPYFYRNVGVYAKMIGTIDHLSDGRIIAGLGIGDPNEAQTSLGITAGSISHRMKGIEEYIVTLKRLLTGQKVSEDFFGLTNAEINPLPVQDPHPPVLLGGGGEKKTLRIVAKHCDMSNFNGTYENIEHKLSVLENWCNELGTSFSAITKTMSRAIVTGANENEFIEDRDRYLIRTEEIYGYRPDNDSFANNRFVGTLEEVGEQFDQYKALGINHLALTINTPGTRALGREIVNLLG